MYSHDAEMAGIFDWLGTAAKKVVGVANTVSQVADTAAQVQSGQRKVAVVGSGSPSLVIPVPGKPYGASIPILPLALGAGVLLLLMMRRR